MLARLSVDNINVVSGYVIWAVVKKHRMAFNRRRETGSNCG